MRNNFEAAVAHLLPMDPVAKRSVTGTKQGTADILDTTAEVSAFGPKPVIGKTGVHLRYHKNTKNKRLTKEQWDKLWKWLKTPQYSVHEGKTKAAKKSRERFKNNSKREKTMAATVQKEIEKQIGTPQE